MKRDVSPTIPQQPHPVTPLGESEVASDRPHKRAKMENENPNSTTELPSTRDGRKGEALIKAE
jgi:hypothetical protein